MNQIFNRRNNSITITTEPAVEPTQDELILAHLIDHMNEHKRPPSTLLPEPVPTPIPASIPLRKLTRRDCYSACLTALTGTCPLPPPTRVRPDDRRSLAYLQGANRPTPAD